MRKPFLLAAAVAVAAGLSGCKPEDDVTVAPSRPSYSFSGTIDPRFVGSWRADPAPTALWLKKDGSAEIVSVEVSPRGRSSNKLAGSWLATGNSLLLKYREPGSHEKVVLKYSADLSGNMLKLVQAGNGVKAIYARKSN